jgi:urease accessory protein
MAALLQLGSSLLPIGNFSYSQGFERAVHDGWVKDQASASAWIESHWHAWFAPLELQVLGAAMTETPTQLAVWQRHFLATRDSKEALEECLQLGSSLRRWLISLKLDEAPEEGIFCALLPDPDETSGLHRQADMDAFRWLLALENRPAAPLAFAVCARVMGLNRREAMMAWAWSWLENQSQCAIKIIPLGQSLGQQMLYRLLPQTLHRIDESVVPMWGFAPRAAIASMRHERQYSRLYRS